MNVISFILLLVTGLGMAVPGLYLATLGGSLYYAIAGALITVSAVLVLKRRDSGIFLYLLVFAATIAWTVMETGLDGWAMMPRLVFLAGGAIWLLLTQPKVHRLRLAGVVAALLVLSGAVYFHAQRPHGVALPLAAGPSAPASSGEWANYGNSQHATRYSPLDQITPANASNLVPAWTYHAGMQQRDRHAGHQLELTPLMVDGLLFGCDVHTAVFALDPVTGREVWRHDTPIDAALGGRGVCRGVSFFRAPAGTTECPTRILVGTVDNRLIALDAKTGKSCSNFRRRRPGKIRARPDQSHIAARDCTRHCGDRLLCRRQYVD
jgi:quinoprotein glucose dehydrogenase